jgi:hypothetical protein
MKGNDSKMAFGEYEIEPTEAQLQFLQPYIAKIASKDTTLLSPPVNSTASNLSRELMAAQQLGVGFFPSSIPHQGMFPQGMMFQGGLIHRSSNDQGRVGRSQINFGMRPSASPTLPAFGREESGTSSDWYGANSSHHHASGDAHDALKRENLALKVELVTVNNFIEEFEKQNTENASSFAIMQKQLQQCTSQTAKIEELKKAVEKLNKQDKAQKVRIEKLHHQLATRGLLGSNTDWKAAV